MSGAAVFWVAVFVCATLLFFGTAAVITVAGVRDLRDLLSGSATKDVRPSESENENRPTG